MRKFNLLPVVGSIILSAMINLSSDAVAQSVENASNTIYVELGGNAVLYSINYDRLLTQSFSGRVGIMYYSAQPSNASSSAFSITIIPIVANYLAGSGSSKLELGAGVDIFTVSALPTGESGQFIGFSLTESAVLGTAVIAYRYHPKSPGLNFRIGFTPTFGWSALGGSPNFLPWLGLSVGYSF